MSRNRCSSQCSCGYELGLQNATTRPLSFNEYLNAIGWQDCAYFDEYENLIVCQVQCPECGTLFAMWIGGAQWNHALRSFRTFGCRPFDTSYWYAFNDEPSERDLLSVPIGRTD